MACTRLSRIGIGVGVLGILLTSTGCHTYQESGLETIQPRDQVRVFLDEPAFDRVQQQAVVSFPAPYWERAFDPATARVRARVDWVDEDALSLSLRGRGLTRFEASVTPSEIVRLERAQLDPFRTVMGGVALGAVGYLTYQAMDAVFGSTGPETPPPDMTPARGPRLTLPVP